MSKFERHLLQAEVHPGGVLSIVAGYGCSLGPDVAQEFLQWLADELGYVVELPTVDGPWDEKPDEQPVTPIKRAPGRPRKTT